ncbi:MAG TPA: hypothetical protein VGX00_05290 [Thermoplasmata archaeon]|nr:hypothetical protein [Thermoplasmata archaeon]
MEDAPSRVQHLGLKESSLLPGESVLRHWNSPHGIGVLTESRLLLLGHRGPIHREVEWVVDLRRIDSIEVVQLEEVRQYGYGSHATYLGGGKDGGMYYLGALPGSFDVRVDGVTVFRGTPAASEEIQLWIDGAKTDLSRAGPSQPTL